MKAALILLMVSAIAVVGIQPASAAAAPVLQAAGVNPVSNPPLKRYAVANPSAAVLAAATTAAAQWPIAQKALSTDPNGRVVFDAAGALALGVQKSLVDEFATGIEAGGGRVIGAAVDAGKVATARSAAVALASNCQGINELSYQWFGQQLKLDSCVTGRIIGALSAGAGTAALIALITSETGIGGLAGGIVAALFTIGAGVLGSCAADGTGVIIDPAWCAAQ